LCASFFELTTLLAFSYFRDCVDVAVIETGLGGRLDATNLINPICTIITSISCEHTHILGEELEQIAAEKGGIIKPRVPLVLGPKARFASIETRAHALEAPLIFSDKVAAFYDVENSAIAELALRQLPLPICEEAIHKGCAIRPSCRFEVQDDVVFDVAHNPDAFAHLVQALQLFFPKKALRFVVGFSADKDYKHCLEMLSPVAEHIHLVQADSQRAATPEAVAMEIKKTPYTLHASVQEGVRHAYTDAIANHALLVIAGSFYIMAAAKEALDLHSPTTDTLPLSDTILGSACSSLRTSASPIKKSSTSSGLGKPLSTPTLS
jgi:dihydrofolate synthase/folylpolyglutamate synthase